MSSAAVARPFSTSRRLAVPFGAATAVDIAVALGALAASLALSSRHDGALRPGPSGLDWTSAALLAGSTLPLVAWRRSPLAVFAVTASMSVVLGGLGYSIGVLVGPSIALYLWAASRDANDSWSRRDTVVVVALFLAYLAACAIGDEGFPGIELLHTGLAFAGAWFAGERTRLRREHIADLEERAARADREAERERRLALAEERARIARDLHDSVGHAINVIVVRAGAARLRHDQQPERSRAALETIEDIARQTAGEIDQIVGTLRGPNTSNGSSTIPPGLASLSTLVADHAANGFDVTLRTAGAPRLLDRAVDIAAYRILQEALTNAARHGTGRADVELAFYEDTLGLTITNPVFRSNQRSSDGGHGLIGMTERANLLGGTLTVDSSDNCFCVAARLPYCDERLP
jgi:signal transduction histidine kinase